MSLVEEEDIPLRASQNEIVLFGASGKLGPQRLKQDLKSTIEEEDNQQSMEIPKDKRLELEKQYSPIN